MLDVIRKVLALLSPKERKQAYLLLGMILVMAFLDVVGIASIMPFMTVLASPEAFETNAWLFSIYTKFGFTDPEHFQFFLGLVVFVALLVSISFKAVTNWAILHFTQMSVYSISRQLVAGYLHQPYSWFLNRHSADLSKMALSEVHLVVQGSLMPLMHLLAQGTMVIAILILLFAVDPFVALVVGGGIAGAYGLIYLGLRNLLDRLGRERVSANEMRFKVVSEMFGGIKQVKLSGMEHGAVDRFDIPARRFARTQVIAQIVGMMPRYALEIIAFGTMLPMMLFLMRSSDGLQGVLPIIGLYALAGYRIVPAIQSGYNYLTKLRFSANALDRLHRDVQAFGGEPAPIDGLEEKLICQHAISTRNVTYIYENSLRPAVEDISLEIPAQTTIGFVGATGSGKTTVVDILLGLLEPAKGTLRVDGKVVCGANRRAWQTNIGYVPQQIFLSDESIAANIAFGIPNDNIDMLAVERAATIANLHEFIAEELPDGYQTLVGERGVRISGGQRQRIGIARALYHRPGVLVLDEATSALDNITEQAVMEALYKLEGEITIIMIAHRLTTVRECDRIYVLDQGRLVETGNYGELSANSTYFQAMMAK